MATLTVTGSAGTISPGAIIGDLANPFCATFLNTGGNYLTTGSLSAGDTGEFGNLTDFTVEFWFQCSALPAALRVIAYGPEISAGNRQWGFELNIAGTVRFYVRNSVPTVFLITSTTALVPGQWYYIVGAVDSTGALVRLYINAVQEASTAWVTPVKVSSLSATTGDMRIGDSASTVTHYYDELATYRRFIGASRITAHYQGGIQRGFAGKLPGARLGDILDNCASVHAPRSLQLGVRSVLPRYESAQPPIDEMHFARAADNADAMLFVADDGTITFLAADHRSNAPYNADQATYGDAGGSELPYLDATIEYTDGFIANIWNATRTLGPSDLGLTGSLGQTQTASDAASISSYFSRPQDMSDIPVYKDSDALDIATAMLAKYKQPMQRVVSLQPNMADPETARVTYELDLGSRIRFLRTPPGGGARLDQHVYVQKIEHSGVPGEPPTCKLTVSPL